MPVSSAPRSSLLAPRGAASATGGATRLLRRARVVLLLHRRAVAAVCAATAVWCVLRVLSPSPDPGIPLQVAAHDLPAGTVVTGAHLRRALHAPESIPDGVVHSPVGQTLASAVRRGEPLTDARMLAPGLTAHLDGRAAVPVRVHDADVVALLQVGDRVDVVVVDPRGARQRTIARDALVVGLPDGSTATTARDGRLVVLGVPPADAAEVAGAGVEERVQVFWPAPGP